MNLHFEDWHYGQSSSFPESSGIYCVFSEHLGDLIYIGQASNIRERIQNHERWSDFEKHKTGEQLATTYALLGVSYRDEVEGRLIKNNKPPENKTVPTAYFYGKLTLSGYVWGLKG